MTPTELLAEIEGELGDIITDMFGNYFMQALFRRGNSMERQRILKQLAPSLSHIACNRNGTYALQSMVDDVHPSAAAEIDILRQALSYNTMQVLSDDHGTHVVQRFLKRFAPKDCDFLFRVAASNCLHLAASSNGVTVLNLVLDRAPRQLRDALIGEIVENTVFLAQHPYGNYVIQHLLGGRKGSSERRRQQGNNASVVSKGNVQLGGVELCSRICARLAGNYVALARHKYSSNVIEEVRAVAALVSCAARACVRACASRPRAHPRLPRVLACASPYSVPE